MKTVIGIDLGGTNVRVAKVTEDGQILQVVFRTFSCIRRHRESYG